MITTKKRSYKKFYVPIAILLVLFTGYPILQHYLTPAEQLQHIVSGITVGLNVTAYHHGQTTPYATRWMPNDLVLDNFNNFLMNYIFGIFGVSSSCASLTTTGNVVYSDGYGGTCTNLLEFSINTNCNIAPYCGGVISIGTGSGPSRNDYKLSTLYNSASVSSSTCSAGSTDSVLVSGSVPITSTVTISEAGLNDAILGYSYNQAGSGTFLMLHDSFTGINAVNGDTVTIQYTISLNNAGFNVNLCIILAAMFTGSVNTTNYPTSSTGVSITLTKTGGSTNSFYVWCNIANTNAAWLISTTSGCTDAQASSNTAYIAIGTGSTAFTPTSNQLNTQLATSTVATYKYSSANGQIYWTTSFNIGTTNTISEAGLFLTLNSNNYMFAAKTFSGQTETANQAWGITLQVTD